MYVLYTNQFKYGTHYLTDAYGFSQNFDFARIFNSRNEASDVAKKFKLSGWHILKLIPSI